VKPLLLRIVLKNIALGLDKLSMPTNQLLCFAKTQLLPTSPVNAKHLGLPIPYDKSKASVFSDILDKVNGKIKG